MGHSSAMKGSTSALLEGGRLVAREGLAFKSDAEILEAARVLLALRAAIGDAYDEDKVAKAAAIERRLTPRLQRAIDRSPADLHLVATFRRHRLNRIEREILLGLVLAAAGMVACVRDVEDLQGLLGRSGRDGLRVLRALEPRGRLVRARLVEVIPDDLPTEMSVLATATLLDPLLRRGSHPGAWAVETYEGLLDELFGLFGALRDRAEELSYRLRWGNANANIEKMTLRVDRGVRALERTVEIHPDWPVRALTGAGLEEGEVGAVVVLLGKELGYLRPGDDLFTGDGLARCMSEDVPKIRQHLRRLLPDGKLRRHGFIRPCGGPGFGGSGSAPGGIAASQTEDEATVRHVEFELTDGFLERLAVPRARLDRIGVRKPIVRLDSLVLPPPVLRALEMIAAQVRHGATLRDDWGLAEAIPYGAGLTALFSGPPGVGKTAAAEALARELDREILVADYSEIQNCWAGQTEKNIVRVFRQAAEAGAVLFWDEADAMFFSRDAASQVWEVRDVNVLLQEIERFPGLVVLATNRRVHLDAALERRIALKVEFVRPGPAERRAIWSKLLPDRLPLAEDVDLDRLAAAELSGGEIKNVVLNAARLALARGGPSGRVRHADFDEALGMESGGRWTGQGRIGFGG